MVLIVLTSPISYFPAVFSQFSLFYLKTNLLSPCGCGIIMQDGAPAHTSNKTQAYLRENFDEFWSKEKWPPSSPDANPMDFSVQSILETKVCKKNHSSVKLLTKSLQQEWKKISVDEIRKICAAAPNRLKAIAEKEGHHVE